MATCVVVIDNGDFFPYVSYMNWNDTSINDEMVFYVDFKLDDSIKYKTVCKKSKIEKIGDTTYCISVKKSGYLRLKFKGLNYNQEIVFYNNFTSSIHEKYLHINLYNKYGNDVNYLTSAIYNRYIKVVLEEVVTSSYTILLVDMNEFNLQNKLLNGIILYNKIIKKRGDVYMVNIKGVLHYNVLPNNFLRLLKDSS
jgi:hypothetical protein